jgi:tetratricopeptide (TPR) repeat protein
LEKNTQIQSSAMGNLAITYESLGKYADAEKLQIQVLDMRSRLLGEEHPDTISAMNNLANTYESLEKYEDAEKLKIQVLDIEAEKSPSSGYGETSWRTPRYN